MAENQGFTWKVVANALQTHSFSQRLRTPLLYPGTDMYPGNLINPI